MPAGEFNYVKVLFAAFGFGPRRQLPLKPQFCGLVDCARCARLIPGRARRELRPEASENRARSAQLARLCVVAYLAISAFAALFG